MKEALKNLLSMRNKKRKKVITILGIKITFENPKWYIRRSHRDKDSIERSAFMDKVQEEIRAKYEFRNFDLENYINNLKTAPDYLCVDCKHNFLNILLKKEAWFGDIENLNGEKDYGNVIFTWGIRPNEGKYSIIHHAFEHNKKIIFVEDSFLRSINTMADTNALEKYKKGISFTFDDLTCYFDATGPSRLEQMLNDKSLIITEEQKNRARKCIEKIVTNHLTKYNHQPIYTPKIGRDGVKKVLVVDQSYGDMSILKGLGSDETFKTMLECAIKENPDADIIVKTHPDTIAGSGGYYTKLKQKENIYTQTKAINPISLIQYCDKVYVCTTQFGFEALMCGKEVHTFGMPFYAGWGLTTDSQKCARRTNTRTLEEVFYIAYILYSYYVNPDKNCRCEIEEAMDYLLKLRNEYFKDLEN